MEWRSSGGLKTNGLDAEFAKGAEFRRVKHTEKMRVTMRKRLLFMFGVVLALGWVAPVLAQTTSWAPLITAWVMAAVMPRSLKDAVGFTASYLRYSSKPPPASAARRGAGTSGVLPSSSVMTFASAGSQAR